MQFHGRRGVVDVDISVTPRIATKKALDTHRHGALRKEAAILKKLNESGISYVPEVQTTGDGWFSYIWIPGVAFDKVFDLQSPQKKMYLINEFIDKAYELDRLGIIHGELDRPMSNILVNEDALRAHTPCISFIDFERGYWQDYSGKNLRHVMQRLHRIGCISLTQCKERGLYDTEKLYHTLKKITLPEKNTRLSGAVLLIVCLLLLDQVSKRVLYDLAWGAETLLLHPVFNTGIGRSLPMPLWITICLAVVLSGALLGRMKKSNHFPMRALLLIAGALGNAIDRARLGGVRDFIDLQYRPVFNFADIYLTISCLLIIRTTYHTKERL